MQSKKLRKALIGTAVSLGATVFLPMQDAAAQGRTAAQAILEEVVVTARRREESLEDLPLSVVAISGEALQAQGIYNTRQIGDYAANVNFQSEDRSQVAHIHIRGIGGGFANPIQVFGAGMYMDGHYLAGSLANFMSTLDIERVEVLRGPQGTLFGKNMTGGAVNIVTTRPQPEFESEVLLRAGDFGQQDVRGMLNVPFSENVLGRFSIANEQNDGYYHNRTLNTDTDWTDGTAFRGSLRFLAGENWTIDATYLHYEEKGGNTGMQCELAIPQSVIDTLAADGQDMTPYLPYVRSIASPQWGGGNGHIEKIYRGATTDMWDDCLADNAAGDFVNSSEGPDSNKVDSDNFFVSAVWDSGGQVGAFDNLQVRTNISARESKWFYQNDRDKTSLPLDSLSHVGDWGFSQENKSLEVIFDATVNDRLNFLVGVYWFDDDANTGTGECWDLWKSTAFPQIQADLSSDPNGSPTVLDPTETTANYGEPGSVPCGPSVGGSGNQFQFIPDNVRSSGIGSPPVGAFQQVNTSTESKAVFAHMNYSLSDLWELELGARWTEDDRGFNIIEFDPQGTCEFRGPGLHCISAPEMNYFSVLEGGFFNEAQKVFSEVTPMVSLTRNLAGGDTLDQGIVYFLISEGFLTGSFNDEVNLFLTPELAPLVGYGPEHVTNYEVGFKGTFRGGRLRLNADVFWMDYTDKQEAVNIDNSDGRFGPDPNLELTQNAGQVDIYGIELELRASPWDGGFVTLDLGYLIDEYSNFLVDDPDNVGQKIDRSVLNVEDRQPDWTINASVGHTFSLGSGATLTPQIAVYAQGEYEWQPGQRRDGPATFCFQDSYSRWRTRVTYAPASGNWEASLFGDNIGSESYFLYCENSRTGIYDHADGRPDWWGAEFVYRWGTN